MAISTNFTSIKMQPKFGADKRVDYSTGISSHSSVQPMEVEEGRTLRASQHNEAHGYTLPPKVKTGLKWLTGVLAVAGLGAVIGAPIVNKCNTPPLDSIAKLTGTMKASASGAEVFHVCPDVWLKSDGSIHEVHEAIRTGYSGISNPNGEIVEVSKGIKGRAFPDGRLISGADLVSLQKSQCSTFTNDTLPAFRTVNRENGEVHNTSGKKRKTGRIELVNDGKSVNGTVFKLSDPQVLALGAWN